MKKFQPRSYQELGINFVLANPRCALWAQPGLGKTSVSLTVIDMLRLLSEIDRTLVVVPKRVLDTEGWQRELTKWTHLQDLAIETLTGNPQQRREKLRSPAPVHLINYELLPWLLDELARAWPYDMVILDESTRVQGHDSTWFRGNPSSKEHVALGSKLTQPDGRVLILDATTKLGTLHGNTRIRKPKDEDAPTRLLEFAPTAGLKHVAGQTKRWLNLTGTPMSNGVGGLWSQTHLLDGGERLGENISRFREQFMAPHPYVKHQWVEQPDALERIMPRVRDICLSIKAADYFDLPELVPNVIEVPLPVELRADYKHLEDQFFLALEGHIVEAVNSAVLGNKLLQFTGGAMYTEKGSKQWEEVHRLKLDALRELADEVGGPMLIAYHFDTSPQRILKALPGAVLFDGTLGMIDAFAAGKIRHLLIHPQSAGHGVEGLQDGTDTIAFFESNWSLEAHDQVIERIGPTRQLQSGHPRPVFAHYIAMQDTIDERVLERLIEKKSTQEILMNAMRRRALK